MCGILGERVFKSNRLIDKHQFMRLLNLSRQRGPDSQDYFTNGQNIQLGSTVSSSLQQRCSTLGCCTSLSLRENVFFVLW